MNCRKDLSSKTLTADSIDCSPIIFLFLCVLEKDESVKANFKMYNLHDRYIDVWMGDQMNTALRRRPMFDAIVTDRKCSITL